jgi:hypothetical protein
MTNGMPCSGLGHDEEVEELSEKDLIQEPPSLPADDHDGQTPGCFTGERIRKGPHPAQEKKESPPN